MIKTVIFLAIIGVGLAAPQYYKNYADPRLANILRLENEIYPDGRYHYAYDTENGISAEEAGEQRPASNNNLGTYAQGFYKYTSPEGLPVDIVYTADENGYHPSGNVLPTSPPIPDAILRSIAFIQARQQSVNNPYNINSYDRYNRYQK